MITLENGLKQTDSGKVWQNKTTLAIGGTLLLLGCGDSIDNWQEIDAVTTTITVENGT